MLRLSPVQQSFTRRKKNIILDHLDFRSHVHKPPHVLRYGNSCKSFLPNKAMRSSAVDGPIPHFGGGAETSLHREDSGFLLRSVPDYSDTNPQAMHPECGGNTPVIPEHHRKRSAAPRGRMRPPLLYLSFKTKTRGWKRPNFPKWHAGDVKARSSTAETKQLGRFYARPPCVLRPGGVFV